MFIFHICITMKIWIQNLLSSEVISFLVFTAVWQNMQKPIILLSIQAKSFDR